MPTCVYCRSEKANSDFNREHVVPDSFGRFKGALVLHGCVCSECNSYFGRTVDRTLARESLEGLERFSWGVKAQADIAKFRYRNVRLFAAVEGDFKGCILELVPDPSQNDGFRARPVAQVGLARKDGIGFTYFLVEEFKAGVWQSDDEIDPNRGVKIFQTDVEEVKAQLAEAGVEFKAWRELEGPTDPNEAKITQQVRYTDEHLRAIAKIAFNYLTFVHGPDFVLSEAFDSTRKFIRYGFVPFLPAVALSDQEIFRPPNSPDDPNQRAVAHLVTVTKPLNADVTIGQVALFNWMRYDVVLAHSVVPGLIESGHLFNPRELEVYRLGKKSTGAGPEVQATRGEA